MSREEHFVLKVCLERGISYSAVCFRKFRGGDTFERQVRKARLNGEWLGRRRAEQVLLVSTEYTMRRRVKRRNSATTGPRPHGNRSDGTKSEKLELIDEQRLKGLVGHILICRPPNNLQI